MVPPLVLGTHKNLLCAAVFKAWMLKRILADFLKSEYSRSAPRITPAVLLSAISAYAIARPNAEDADGSPAAYGRRLLARVGHALLQPPVVPEMPAQDRRRPTVIFDINGFLVSSRFSLSRFDFVFYKRAFCEEFLFSMAGHYELINISDMHAAEGTNLMDKIDPYGCVSYRLFTREKKNYTPMHLNRPLERLVVLSTRESEFNSAFESNTIRIPEWHGSADACLFDLLHFFNSLHYMKIDDFRPTIRSYEGKDFLASFKSTQKKLFNQRNLFSPVDFEGKLDAINEQRLLSYQSAKAGMEQNKKNNWDGFYRNAGHFLKNIIL